MRMLLVIGVAAVVIVSILILSRKATAGISQRVGTPRLAGSGADTPPLGMPHEICTGNTGSGKTLRAREEIKRIARKRVRGKRNPAIVVLDHRIHDPGIARRDGDADATRVPGGEAAQGAASSRAILLPSECPGLISRQRRTARRARSRSPRPSATAAANAHASALSGASSRLTRPNESARA